MSTRPRRLRYDPNNDLYGILGVISTATPAQLQQAFRRRAKEVHPDRNPDKQAWAHEQFQLLNEAYDILTNDQYRAVYDRQRRFYFARHGLLEENDFWPGSRQKSAPPPPRPAYSRPQSRPIPQHGLARWRAILSESLVGPYQYVPVLLLGVLVLNILFIFAYTTSESLESSTPTAVITPGASPTPEISPTPDIMEIRYFSKPRGSLVLEATQLRIISDGTIYGNIPYSVSLTE